MPYKHLLMASAVAFGLGMPVAMAKVPADQAARLGKDLTHAGAEAGGTGDVPAYTGGLQAPPPGIKFDPKTQHPPNPYPGDKPKFTAVADLVAYVTYMSDPSAQTRTRLGVWVLLFLGVFTVFAWMLNREYWKDVH